MESELKTRNNTITSFIVREEITGMSQNILKDIIDMNIDVYRSIAELHVDIDNSISIIDKLNDELLNKHKIALLPSKKEKGNKSSGDEFDLDEVIISILDRHKIALLSFKEKEGINCLPNVVDLDKVIISIYVGMLKQQLTRCQSNENDYSEYMNNGIKLIDKIIRGNAYISYSIQEEYKLKLSRDMLLEGKQGKNIDISQVIKNISELRTYTIDKMINQDDYNSIISAFHQLKVYIAKMQLISFYTNSYNDRGDVLMYLEKQKKLHEAKKDMLLDDNDKKEEIESLITNIENLKVRVEFDYNFLFRKRDFKRSVDEIFKGTYEAYERLLRFVYLDADEENAALAEYAALGLNDDTEEDAYFNAHTHAIEKKKGILLEAVRYCNLKLFDMVDILLEYMKKGVHVEKNECDVISLYIEKTIYLFEKVKSLYTEEELINKYLSWYTSIHLFKEMVDEVDLDDNYVNANYIEFVLSSLKVKIKDLVNPMPVSGIIALDDEVEEWNNFFSIAHTAFQEEGIDDSQDMIHDQQN